MVPNLHEYAPGFRDRADAGRELSKLLTQYAECPDVLVLGLPRGGVPVAYEVSRALNAPLDVFVVRKLGVPGQEELAMGAISNGGRRVINHEIVAALGITQEMVDAVTAREERELKRREEMYRASRPALSVSGKTVIVVDDGLATGSTMRAAVAALRIQQPRTIVVAVPVAAVSACEELRNEVDHIVCARMPESFYAVGMWYEDFAEISDEEIRELLERAAQEHPIQPVRDSA